MNCPSCKKRMRVVDSRPDRQKRRREYRCPKCGYRAFTTEKMIRYNTTGR